MSAASPLRGVLALDLTDESGVHGARLLAELGARVIRVESSTGDALRRRGPFVDNEAGLERSLLHLLYNAGKQSVALALDSAEAWDTVERLSARADVVLAPLEKSAHAHRFFDEARLRAARSDLCVVDVVFRRGSSPGRDAAVTDMIGVAAGGLLDVNGFPDDPPNLPFGKLGYRQVSFTLASTATALVLNRRRRGCGGHMSISLQEALAMTTMQASNQNLWRWWGWVSKRSGENGFRYPVLGPSGTLVVQGGRSTLQTRDGKWVTVALWPATWSRFARLAANVLGSEKLLQAEWDDPTYRTQHHDEVESALEGLCAALTRDEFVEQMQGAGQLVLPVNDIGDLAVDAHLQARGFFHKVYHPLLGRTLRMPGSAFLSSDYPRPALGPAPGLGEHTREVLRELIGLDEQAIERLEASGVAGVSAVSMPGAVRG